MKRRLAGVGFVLVLAMVLSMLPAGFGKPVTAQAASKTTVVEYLQGTADDRTQIRNGYYWSTENASNHKTYVYYSKTPNGRGRYLFQTNEWQGVGQMIVSDNYVWFNQDSTDGLKHYIYRVNLTGTRKLVKVTGFKSKKAYATMLLGYYGGNFYYWLGNDNAGVGGLYRYDTAQKKNIGCKKQVTVRDVCGRYLYFTPFYEDLDNPDNDVLVFDCAVNKMVGRVPTPEGGYLVGTRMDEETDTAYFIYDIYNRKDSTSTIQVWGNSLAGNDEFFIAEVTGRNAYPYEINDTDMIVSMYDENDEMTYFYINFLTGEVLEPVG